MHELISVGLPLIAILAGVLFNRNDTKELRAEMNTRFSEMNSRFGDMNQRFNQIDSDINSRLNKIEAHLDRIDADLRQFYHLTGKLEARMDALEKRD